MSRDTTPIPTITEAQLRAAIVSVVGQAVYDILDSSHGIVAAHERACMVAFLEERTGPEVDCIRTAMRHLKKRGQYAHHEKP
jgi:hypothetical protein